MGRKIIKNYIKGTIRPPEFNVSKIRAMSDKEAIRRAKEDSDAPIVDPKKVKRTR
jgi:hypothetical protein